MIKQKSKHIKGSLLLFLADTLAAHQLGGFKVGVGFSFRKCRNCLVSTDQLVESVRIEIVHSSVMSFLQFRHNFFQARTPELHYHHCSLLHGSLASFNSTTYGVNCYSILNDIPLFNVADWQLPQDIMHVLLEGTLPLEIKHLLHQFTTTDIVTIDQLNVRLESFPFGYNSSRPSTIDPKHLNEGNLRQSGMHFILHCHFINSL